MNFLMGILAEGTPVDVSGTLLTGFTGMINNLISFVTSLLPVVLPLMAAIVMVTGGIKIFKKLRSGTANG